MSFRAKRELLVQVAPPYRAARHGQRSVILDEFVAVTGYDRKYAIRLLVGPIRPPEPIRRPRAAQYGSEVQAALTLAWTAANGICGKRLVPFLAELIPTLERHGHLSLSEEVRQQLLRLSPATADRLLRPLRQPHGLTTTKPGRLLKQHIPVRTFTEWTDVQPGFIEADLVAHCGGSMEGAFLYTLTLTDVATTWTECLPLLHRTQHGVVHALQRARGMFPFPLLGIDTDNGGEFINDELLAYCATERLTFTRGRVANTYCEVAAAMARAGGPTISASYVWHLRTGLRDNPTKRHLEALADLFGVPPAYFFDDETAARIDAELEVALALRDPVLRRLAVRAAGLSRDSLVALAEMVERVRQLEGLLPAVDGPPQPAPESRPTNSRRRRPGQQRPADPPSA